MKRVAVAAFVLALSASARAQKPPQLPPPPPPNSTPQYEPPPPPSQIPPPSGTPRGATPPRRERPERPERPEPVSREPVRRAAPVERAEPVERDEAPRARTGLQLALRSGLSFPIGSISGGPSPTNASASDALSNYFSTQIPIHIDVGWKIIPSLFLGLYTSFSFGSAGDVFSANQCPGSTRSCGTSAIRLGVEIQYDFQPAERLNPWVGYGFGFESSGASASGGGVNVGETFTGLELARLEGGLDWRVSRTFGVGPFGNLALGEYSHEHVQGTNGTADASIPTKALHAWLTLGIRGVLFP